MKCHRISGIPGSKALTQRDNKLRLVPRLRAMWELTITHGDACNLSLLRVRGILVISKDKVFLYYGNPKRMMNL